MQERVLPIEYTGCARTLDGREVEIDLEEPGWQEYADVRMSTVFSLHPKPGSPLPVVEVHLSASKTLVYIARIYQSETGVKLFRMYCLGWKQHFPNMKAMPPVEARMWIYPIGSIVMADEPPYLEILGSAVMRELEAAGLGAKLAGGRGPQLVGG